MTKLLCAGDKCFIQGEVWEVGEDGKLHVRFSALGGSGFHFWFSPEQCLEDATTKSDAPDASHLEGFLSGLDEVENCIAFLERVGTGESFTDGYNQALSDIKKFIKAQKGFTSKEVLEYETRRSDGERVRKDRWETAIRNIAHLFFGPAGAWEIDEVVEKVRGVKLLDDSFREAVARPAVEDETPVAEELKYGRTAGMNRAPDDIPNPNRAAWLRNEVSSFGQTKIYQPQYEELRVHAVNLWNRLKAIKEAIKS